MRTTDIYNCTLTCQECGAEEVEGHCLHCSPGIHTEARRRGMTVGEYLQWWNHVANQPRD